MKDLTPPIKKVMIVAGEQSGDILGAGLIRSIKAAFPDCEFSGIGGERMKAEGLVSHYPIDRLSVMGFVEPLKRLPELLSIIKDLKSRFKSERPDIFIGVDSPDFNIRLELAAKKLGIFSAHYVSPSVWAWRQGRVKKIERAVDLMLALLPFEADFYRKHKVPVAFVGHPLADELPLEPDRRAAREQLGFAVDKPMVALLPGSRHSEVSQLLPVMLASAVELRKQNPELEFILPAATEDRLIQIQTQLDSSLEYIHVLSGQSHEAMTAANFVVMASGTTTLEALLLKRPMVITYKWPRLTWEILKRLVKVPWVGLPNLLGGEELAPELLQDKATVENIVREVNKLLNEQGTSDSLSDRFLAIHNDLRRNASQSAANALIEAWSKRDE